MVSSILATDMAKHNKLLEKFTKRVQITKKIRENPNYMEEHKNIIDEFLLSEKRVDDKRVILNSNIYLYIYPDCFEDNCSRL